MTTDHPRFQFLDNLSAIHPAQALIVRIPAGIPTKVELLATLALGLDFPNYFGWNWDALDECLRDLSWIESPRLIVLAHEDVPLPAGTDGRSTYIEILRDAVESWGPGQPHELMVVFPTRCQIEIDG